MKRLICIAILIATSALVIRPSEAQASFRLGIGAILDGTQPGAGIAFDVPTGDRPYGILISADYYTKSGAVTAPVRGIAIYESPAGASANFYFGAGTGLIYTKKPVSGFSVSSTKALITGVAGIIKNFESMGLYAEVSMDRALTSGTKNITSVRIGISFGGN